VQDRFGHLSARHLAALAKEMGLAQTEVYEVATFYHHFDVVKEGEAAPPALTVRVCDGLSCEMAGAKDLLARLPAILGKRGARDPGAVHRPLRAGAGRRRGSASDRPGQLRHGPASGQGRPHPARPGRLHRPAGLQGEGGYALLQDLRRRRAGSRRRHQGLEDSGLRGLGGAGFPAGRKWRIVRARRRRA
jgi:formate dehydrogenase beta subunit